MLSGSKRVSRRDPQNVQPKILGMCYLRDQTLKLSFKEQNLTKFIGQLKCRIKF